MNGIPATQVRDCVHDMRNRIAAMRLAFDAISGEDQSKIKSVLTMADRQLKMLTKLARMLEDIGDEHPSRKTLAVS